VYAIILKHSVLADILFLRHRRRFGYNHGPLADVFYSGGHLRLESSCIQANKVGRKKSVTSEFRSDFKDFKK